MILIWSVNTSRIVGEDEVFSGVHREHYCVLECLHCSWQVQRHLWKVHLEADPTAGGQ